MWVLLVAPGGPGQCGGCWRVLSCSAIMYGGGGVSLTPAALMFTVLVPTLDQLDQQPPLPACPIGSTQTCASMHKCPRDTRRGPRSWCLLLVFNLSRTKSFICSAQRRVPHRPPDQRATELWSACWCSLKGTGMRKRHSVCLTLSQWFQTPPIHHCLPWATSTRLPVHHWIVGPPGWFIVGLMVTGALKE